MATGLDITATGELTDGSGPNGTGTCSGFAFNSLVPRRDEVPVHSDIRGTPGSIAGAAGARLGLCSTAVQTRTGSYYAPCGVSLAAIAAGTANSDCTNFGGGTCVAYDSATENQRKFSSVFLLCEAGTTSTIDVNIEAIQR